jgi:streptogramin lyase
MKTLNTCFLCLLGWSSHFGTAASGQTYDFGTLAGFPSQGSADGPAATAQFFAPQGVAVDPQGNVYVADSDNSIIREISTAGQVTTIAGQAGTPGYLDGTGTNTLFYLPKSVVLGPGGNLYVVDTFNDVVRQLTFTGGNWVVSTLAGQAGIAGSADGTGTNAAFSTPADAAVDAAGNLYVTDLGNDTIRQITPLGAVSTIAGQPGTDQDLDGTNRAADFAGPTGITLDANTNLFVTDAANTLRRLAPVGTNWVVTTIAGQAGHYGTSDGAGTNALFSGPAGVTVDLNENLYVADEFNETIRRLAFNGTNWISSTLAGSPGIRGSADGTNGAARFGAPVGLAADTSGHVFVADVNNNNVRQLTLAGTNAVVTTLAGVGPGSADGTGPSARFWS